MNLIELLDKLPKDERDKIFNKAMPSMFPRSSEVVPNQTSYSAPVKKGTVELLSPSGKVLMRDGELVERPIEIKFSRRVVF